MLIQIVLISAVVILLAVFARNWNTTRMRAWKRIAFIAFCVINVYAVLRPADTTRAAHMVGVGRGTDLVLYALVVAFLSFTVTTYLRFRDLETNYTRLARRIALSEAPRPGEQPHPED